VPTVALTLPGIWDGRNRGGVKVRLRMLAWTAITSLGPLKLGRHLFPGDCAAYLEDGFVRCNRYRLRPTGQRLEVVRGPQRGIRGRLDVHPSFLLGMSAGAGQRQPDTCRGPNLPRGTAVISRSAAGEFSSSVSPDLLRRLDVPRPGEDSR
jgi:hypothetical protein